MIRIQSDLVEKENPLKKQQLKTWKYERPVNVIL